MKTNQTASAASATTAKKQTGRVVLKWTVYASGGPTDNPWDAEKEVEGNTLLQAMKASGFNSRCIDGVIRNEIIEDLQISDADEIKLKEHDALEAVAEALKVARPRVLQTVQPFCGKPDSVVTQIDEALTNLAAVHSGKAVQP